MKAALFYPIFLTAPLLAAPPIALELAEKADGSPWINMADPAGIIDREEGITDTESTMFDYSGNLLLTCSKADARHPSKNHGKTAHLSLWNVKTGEQIWDRARSRGPDEDGDGIPDDAPKGGADEIEISLFSPDGRFVAAGGEDNKIEVWRIREDEHRPEEWLEAPVLIHTLHTGDENPDTPDAAIDCMTWSHDGALLFVGTEEAGSIEVFRTQGDPKTWERVAKASHGGQPGFAVNSLDLTEDDRHLGAVGTDTNGSFWKIGHVKDDSGLITKVELTRIASLPSKNGKNIDGSGREARFEPNGDRHFIFTQERSGLVQVYAMDELLAYNGPAKSGPAPIQILTSGDEIKDGNEIEPATYTNNGRFLIHDGDTRVNGDSEGIFPGYFRIYETAQIQKNAPTPDPVFTQRIQTTEYLSVNPEDSLLASGHGDGTVRLWNINISGSKTLHAEAFNEPEANQWELSEAPENTPWGSSVAISHKSPFRGHRGQHYFAIGNLSGKTQTLTLKDSWNLSNSVNPTLHFSAVASPNHFFEGDFLRILADTNADGEFETVFAEILPNENGDLSFNGQKLNSIFLDDDGKTEFLTFEDYQIKLKEILPTASTNSFQLRIEASTNHKNAEIGIDNLRLTN